MGEADQKQILSLRLEVFMVSLDYRKETFSKVGVCGILCEFNDMRIDRNTVPKGKYQYEVAGDDESGGEPARIKLGIMANFFGTLISGEPLPIGDEGVLWLTGDDFVWL